MKQVNQYSLINRIKQSKSSYMFLAPFAAIFILFTLAPVLISIFFSFTLFNVLEPPKWIGWDNYRRLFMQDQIFFIALKNTFVLSMITGPVSYFLCLFFAWTINELSPKVRSVVTLLFYAPSLASVYVIWKIVFSGDSLGILNSYLMKLEFISSPINWLNDPTYLFGSVIFVVLWSSLGTSFLAFIAGFQNIDRTLFEAGAVDGIKNRWQELWFITLPSMKPQLLFSAVMSITASFGIGAQITALVGFPSANYSVHTLMNHLDDYGSIRFEMGYACAIATLLFVIMISANKIVQYVISKVGG